MEHWYALYAKSRKEANVSEILNGKGIETYLPMYEARVGLQPRRKGLRALFHCYLFARVDFSSRGLSSVQWTPGLRSIVSFGGKPAVVPDEIVSGLRARFRLGEDAWWDGPGLQVG